MPRIHRAACTNCGESPGETPADARANLFTKRIEFRRYGFKGGVVRSRTVAWLCRACLLLDADYNRPENEVSDGMAE